MADKYLLDAAVRGQTSRVRRLLEEEEANVMAKDSNGWTPLHRASRFVCFFSDDVITLLLDKGALIDDEDPCGWTALHHACFNGSSLVTCLLLDKGANINHPDHNGSTPFHRACHHGHFSVALLLLEKGADHTIMDKKGRTAFDVAHRDCSSLSLIIEHGKSVLTNKINFFKSETEKLKERVDTLSMEKLVLLKEKETMLKQEKETWKNRHESMKQEMHTLVKHNNEYKARNNSLTSEMEDLKKQIETLTKAKTELLQENETLMQENVTWETCHKVLGQNIDSLKEQNNMYKTQNESLLEQTVQLKTSLTNLETWHKKEEQLKAEITKLQETVSRHAQKEHEQLQVGYTNLRQRLAYLEHKEEQQEHHPAKIQQSNDQTQQQQVIPTLYPVDVIRRDAETPQVTLPEMKKTKSTDDNEDKDQLLSIDSSLTNEIVTAMVVADMTTTTSTLARHDVTVGNQDEEEPWTEIAHDDDDADRQQHMSRLGVVKSEFAVLTYDQPTPDAVAAEVILTQLANLKNTIQANMARDDDCMKKIVELYQLIETLIGG